ncbi:nucleoside recognition domain-containing protein [Vreelandella neptunia]|uniref:Nucleoside recognition domain-containing protein n=1 Tax=Vreelandella neptunia TaxID=115551 RepID=A0ABZ0YHG1_9GAMM|nr:spore maturation protein [Halomonas neptunia]MDN3559687.1 nucleoside recognition domain-containing protein [Halomonas neptunia]TDW00003.1 spore maturation protein SpmA [Halomonas alkaliantarctica]WQH11536.1 nucleoside recognition domain-containing protein [Halomonas neptunia]
MLNGIWLSFFIAAFAASLWQWLVGGDSEVFARLVQSLFDMAKVSVDIILVLLGTMTLWLGFLSIAEKAGLIRLLGRVLDPLFCRLMPEVPRGHPAMGLISMNFAANILGLDNAATPIGIKAMHSLQSLNPSSETASNAQILFLVLNTSSLTLLPVTIFMYRAQQGAADPTLVFLPILLATTASSLAGLLAVALMQRLKLWQPVVLAYLLAAALALGLLITTLAGMSAQALAAASTLVGNLTLFSIVMMFLVVGALRGVRVYDAFIEGAKEGLSFTITLLPYLIAMLVAVGVLRASGVLDAGLGGIRWIVEGFGWDTRFVDALPTAFVKPLSGSGARAMMIETMDTFGVDSFPGLLAATMQGSTETTFYVLAVYFGAVGITRIRHGLGCALVADLAGVTTAIAVCYWFFG